MTALSGYTSHDIANKYHQLRIDDPVEDISKSDTVVLEAPFELLPNLYSLWRWLADS